MIFVIAADYCWVDCGSNELAKRSLHFFFLCICMLNSGTGLHTFTVVCVFHDRF